MKNRMRLGVVLLAAGRSKRFGTNKLLADFAGRPLVCRAMDAIRALPSVRAVVVTGHDEMIRLAGMYGYEVIVNNKAELGQSHSIRLGIEAVLDLDAALLLVGDQPLLAQDSLLALVDAFEKSGKGIACLQDETHIGNPAMFGKKYFGQLMRLSGDRGAKGILRANAEDLLVVPCLHANELSDADTPDALERIRASHHRA